MQKKKQGTMQTAYASAITRAFMTCPYQAKIIPPMSFIADYWEIVYFRQSIKGIMTECTVSGNFYPYTSYYSVLNFITLWRMITSLVIRICHTNFLYIYNFGVLSGEHIEIAGILACFWYITQEKWVNSCIKCKR